MHNQAGATGSTAIADLSQANPAYAAAPQLMMPRMHLCATLLPDRTVLVNGGAMMEESAADAAFDAEIYHPDPGGGAGAGRWRRDSRVPRLYHSVALLMPDGKVVTAGSNPQRKTEELRIEVYWPPYLFAGERPVCRPDAGRGELRRGGLRPGAGRRRDRLGLPHPPGRHHPLSDAEQRLVDVPHQVTAADRVSLALPGSGNLAPPGWYLLFAVNTAGVPSEASWVHLT